MSMPKTKKTPTISKSVITGHVTKTNDAIYSATKAQGKIFDVVFDAYEELASSTTAWKSYKSRIRADRSTIAKIVKIAQSEFVRVNREKLPYAFATLYSVAMMTGSSTAKGAKDFSLTLQAELESKNITRKSTLAEIKALLPKEAEKKTSQPSGNIVSLDSSIVSKEQKSSYDEAIRLLKECGFQIKDMAKKSLPPKSANKKASTTQSTAPVKEAV